MKKLRLKLEKGFLDSSVCKESTCNAGSPSLIPALERSAAGVGYPLQYSWASLVAQLVKNLPAVQETCSAVQSLGWEDPLEKGKASHSSILAWRILGHKELDLIERLSLSHSLRGKGTHCSEFAFKVDFTMSNEYCLTCVCVCVCVCVCLSYGISGKSFSNAIHF